MNKRIRELSEQAEKYADDNFRGEPTWSEAFESKFAELIVKECAACCGSQADMRNIRKRFGLSVESNIKYPSPEKSGSTNSQYEREYNLPEEGNK
jgi:hypothetical protein